MAELSTIEDRNRLRRRVQAALIAALAASVAANILAAEPTPVARAVAAWPPIALLLTIDVLGRVPTPNGWTGRLATVATALVAGVAALASFAHVRAVALAVGESELVAWVLPLSVDGLAVVCSIALVELNKSHAPIAPAADGITAEAEPTSTVSAPRSRQPAQPNHNGLRPLLFTSSPVTAGNGTKSNH